MSGDEHGQEVGGEVLAPRLVPPPRHPLAIERQEHLAALVPPAQRGVGVVAILLDALLELAVGVVCPLVRWGEGVSAGDLGAFSSLKGIAGEFWAPGARVILI